MLDRAAGPGAAAGPDPEAPGSVTDPGAPEVATIWSTELADHAGPLLRHHVLRRRLLRLGGEGDVPGRGWRQRLVRALVHRSGLDQAGQLDRPGLALQPQVLAGG